MSAELRLANFWGKKRSNSSEIWTHFGFKCSEAGVILDKTKATCRHCFVDIKYAGGNTSNLATHFNNHHLQDHKPAAMKQPSVLTAFGATKKYPRDSKHQQFLQRRVVEYLIADLRPLSTVESSAFKDLCSSLDPKFALPDRKTVSSVIIPRMYRETKTKVKELLKSTDSVALTTDGWTSNATQSYMTFTAHFIDQQWALQSVGLQTRHTPEQHTSENLRDILLETLEEWNLTEKLITGVLDNARNMTKAWELLQRPFVNCFAHTMNLAVKKGLAVPSLHDTLKRARRLVCHFHHSPTQLEALKRKQESLNLPVHKLKMDVETRWNSTYDMIVSILENEEAVAASLKMEKKYRHLALTPDELTSLEEAKDLLKPWKELTVTMSSEKDVTISLVTPSLHKLKNILLQQRDGDSEITREMKEAMQNDLKTRYKDESVRLFLHVACLLDPRFKSLDFLTEEERWEAHCDLKHRMVLQEQKAKKVQIKPEEEAQSEAPICAAESSGPAAVPEVIRSAERSPDAKRRKLDNLQSFFGDFVIAKTARVHTLQERVDEELRFYLSSDCVGLDQGVLDWWNMHAKQLPIMSQIAKQLLCVPATSTPAERAFSKAGILLSSKRAMLKPHRADMILFLNKNYFPLKK